MKVNSLVGHLQAEVKVRKTMHSKKWMSIAEYVLKHGKRFNTSPLNPAEKRLLDAASFNRPEKKNCYGNSMMLWRDDNRFKYAEGYSRGRIPLPILHAWNVINGKVVDMTWERGVLPRRLKNLGLSETSLGKGIEYFGMTFSDKFMNKHIMKCVDKGYWISVLDNWEDGHPLLKRGR